MESATATAGKSRKTSQAIENYFTGRFNMLVLEDERHVLNTTIGHFRSPSWKIRTAGTLEEAEGNIRKLRTEQAPWHCWIIDIDLGKGASGLSLLERYPNFPFVIVLSGIRSMESAAEAMERGAWKVFDKGSPFHKLFDLACRMSALGWLLKGFSNPDNLEVFKLLTTRLITMPADWADNACISLRQLQNICMINTGLPPRLALPLYYGLYYMLRNHDQVCLNPRCCSRGRDIVEREEFFLDCLDIVENNRFAILPDFID